MFEFSVSLIIAAGSVALLAYWFRYTCLLIVSAKTAQDYAGEVAATNQLAFLDVQSCLHQSPSADLVRLHGALEHDYALLTYLLKNAQTKTETEGLSIETGMLAGYYRVMNAWYRVSRNFSPTAARSAVEDMAMVVAHLANVMGERNACSSAA